ncbi:SMP-30/gluconolactonase/LRE family protein [Spirosoma gilvum]
MYSVRSLVSYAFIAGQTVFSALGQVQSSVTEAHRSQVAFQLPETGLITEGVAHDPKTGSFYISSVHERKIIRYSAKQMPADLSQPKDSLWGVFGMKVDAERRLLWACSSALPQAKGITTTTNGRSALVVYDLKSNRLKRTYPIPDDGKAHLLGDLTLAKDGTVYSTDSRTPWIYRLKAGTTTVTPFLTDTLFRSLQGLALSDDEKTLFVADYRRGLLAVDLATRQVRCLSCTQSTDLSGIDGLYYYPNSLIAIQNRRKPYRISRVRLAEHALAIEQVDTLDSDHPLASEPTLGVIVGNQFYYIANSQWDAFDETGKPVPDFPAQKPTILVLLLDSK